MMLKRLCDGYECHHDSHRARDSRELLKPLTQFTIGEAGAYTAGQGYISWGLSSRVEAKKMPKIRKLYREYRRRFYIPQLSKFSPN